MCPFPSPVTRILLSGLNATESAPALNGSVKVPILVLAVACHAYRSMSPLSWPTAKSLPSALNAADMVVESDESVIVAVGDLP